MKNEIPPVTATYFITLIKAYLQGSKTKKDILSEASGLLPVQVLTASDSQDVTYWLTDTAREINEHFFYDIIDQVSNATDTAPTRDGIIHQLKACVAGDISVADLLDWATWHNMDSESGADIFDDLAVAFFCQQLLPIHFQQFSDRKLRQALEIFRLDCGDPVREKIALVLLLETEKKAFLYFLNGYAAQEQSLRQLDLYLMKRFGITHQQFPYMAALQTGACNEEKLAALLEKAALLGAGC
jgi:hypothetical protein